jgi:putative addiction module component (TIGR02574 family)
MSDTAKDIMKKALSLNENDRATLAGALIESLEGEADPGAEAAWDAEIERRVAEIDAKSVETVPWSQVRDRLFRGFE